MVRGLCTSASALIFVAATLGTAAQFVPASREDAQAVGNQACRPCHQAIDDSYARSAMARTSGAASTTAAGCSTAARQTLPHRAAFDTRHYGSGVPSAAMPADHRRPPDEA
jgi:hypothetical protein